MQQQVDSPHMQQPHANFVLIFPNLFLPVRSGYLEQELQSFALCEANQTAEIDVQ
jgi:hypothetical protein